MVRHGLGIAIFSVLSAVSLSVIGCGGSGSGMGVLDPFPTNTSIAPTSTTTPEPPAPPEPVQDELYDALANRDIHNPTYQYLDDEDNIYTLQGFYAGGSGLSSQQCKYRLIKYSIGSKEEEPKEVPVRFRVGNNTFDKNNTFENPFYITGMINDSNTPNNPDDDILYLAVTDLGTKKAVYLMSLGSRADGWNEAKAVNVFDYGTALSTTCPLVCSFGRQSFSHEENAVNTLFWTDYVENGTVKFIAFEEDFLEKTSLKDENHLGIAVSGLNYPSMINASSGPYATVSCQGDGRIYLFVNNRTEDDLRSSDHKYGTGLTNPKFINYITPENRYSDRLNPYDLVWIKNVEDNDGAGNQYLAISSGFALDCYGRATKSATDGALWIYKYKTRYDETLDNLRVNDPEYEMILDNLQYPVSLNLTNPLNDDQKRYLDLAYLTTGTTTLYNNPQLKGTLSFVRYDAKSKKIVNKSNIDILDKLVDPFGLISYPSDEVDGQYPVQFMFTTHWNWGSDVNTDRSHVYCYQTSIQTL
ncbi:MAG: hypothetical protein ACI376_05590 [Candidatus Bruticola sp.]